MKKIARILATLSLLAASSCAFRHRATPADVAAPPTDAAAPADPALIRPQHFGDPAQVITVMMYRLTVPYGVVSRNTAFWKLVDEDAVDVATHATLYDNGLRVGRAPVASWPSFQDLIGTELTDCSITGFTAISGVGSVSLSMTPDLTEETLFVLDEHGATGRIYNHCINQLNFAFKWAPRKPVGTIRISICPVVLTHRTHVDYIFGDDPIDSAMTKLENLYDLHLRADLSPGQFLIIGLSPSADDPNRIGSRFLTHPGNLDHFEDFLLLSTSRIPIHPDIAPATQPSSASASAPLH